MQRMHVEQVEEKENIEELKRYTEMKKQEVEHLRDQLDEEQVKHGACRAAYDKAKRDLEKALKRYNKAQKKLDHQESETSLNVDMRRPGRTSIAGCMVGKMPDPRSAATHDKTLEDNLGDELRESEENTIMDLEMELEQLREDLETSREDLENKNFEIEWWTKIINKKDQQILQLTDGKGIESEGEDDMICIDKDHNVRRVQNPDLVEQIEDLQEQVSALTMVTTIDEI
eukprot:sb/3469507/